MTTWQALLTIILYVLCKCVQVEARKRDWYLG
jgi:hypothetical protein